MSGAPEAEMLAYLPSELAELVGGDVASVLASVAVVAT